MTNNFSGDVVGLPCYNFSHQNALSDEITTLKKSLITNLVCEEHESH